MHPKTRSLLYKLGLSRVFSGVFAKANEHILGKLQRVEPYVTYGYVNNHFSYTRSTRFHASFSMILLKFWLNFRYPNLKNVRELVHKKGFAKIDKQRVPLTDNNIIEQVRQTILATLLPGWKDFDSISKRFLTVKSFFKHMALFSYTLMVNFRNWASMESYAWRILCMKLLMLAHILRR